MSNFHLYIKTDEPIEKSLGDYLKCFESEPNLEYRIYATYMYIYNNTYYSIYLK